MLIDDILYHELALCEAIDLDTITVSSHNAREGIKYFFTIPLDGGANLWVTAIVQNEDTLIIEDVELDADEDYPNTFKTTNQNWSTYKRGVRLGTGETRRILAYIVRRIKQDHPNIHVLTADRVTGLRYKHGNRDLRMALPAV